MEPAVIDIDDVALLEQSGEMDDPHTEVVIDDILGDDPFGILEEGPGPSGVPGSQHVDDNVPPRRTNPASDAEFETKSSILNIKPQSESKSQQRTKLRKFYVLENTGNDGARTASDSKDSAAAEPKGDSDSETRSSNPTFVIRYDLCDGRYLEWDVGDEVLQGQRSSGNAVELTSEGKPVRIYEILEYYFEINSTLCGHSHDDDHENSHY
jgi:hypothetical protein